MAINRIEGPLYKMGDGYVFDLGSYKAYKTTTENGKLTSVQRAFSIRREGSDFRVVYDRELPWAIVRKAIQLIGFYETGELIDIEGIIEKSTKDKLVGRGSTDNQMSGEV